MIFHMNPPIAVEEKNTFSSKIQAQLKLQDPREWWILFFDLYLNGQKPGGDFSHRQHIRWGQRQENDANVLLCFSCAAA